MNASPLLVRLLTALDRHKLEAVLPVLEQTRKALNSPPRRAGRNRRGERPAAGDAHPPTAGTAD
jgi:hypothetical protein